LLECLSAHGQFDQSVRRTDILVWVGYTMGYLGYVCVIYFVQKLNDK